MAYLSLMGFPTGPGILSSLAVTHGSGRLALTAAIILYLGLLIGSVVTQKPYIDECTYSMPSWNLAQNGSFGMPVVEPAHYTFMPSWTKVIPGIDKHWFGFMPLPLVAQAGWYKIFGYSLFSLRMFSVAWAAVALGACFFLVRRLTGDHAIAVVSVVLIAMDQIFIERATMGRMDMMSTALGFAGLSLYANMREKHLSRAIWISNAFVIGAGLSHPNGGMMSFLGLVFLMVCDRQRLHWRHLGLALLPYLVASIGMAAYISIDPVEFWAQFRGASTGRLGALRSPLSAVWREIVDRYLATFGFHKGLPPKASLLRLYPLLVYIAALAAVFLVHDLRRQRGYRTLALLTVVYVVGLTAIDNYKVSWYLVYVTPLLAMVTATFACWARGRFPRTAVAAALLPMLAIPLASTLRMIVRNPYRNQYVPMIRFLKDHSSPGRIVMGSATLIFGYGIRDTLIDDDRLGFYSGKRPAMIVVDQVYQDDFYSYSRTDRKVYEHIRRCLDTEFRPEFRNDMYTVWVRRP